MIKFEDNIEVRQVVYITCTCETIDAIESSVGCTLSGEYNALVTMEDLREYAADYPHSELTKALLTIPFPNGFDGDVIFQQ